MIKSINQIKILFFGLIAMGADGSNFVQNYFGVGSIFWGEKNRDKLTSSSL